MGRQKRIQEEAELNVASFMNLMIVLVLLLMNMVISQLAVLNFVAFRQQQCTHPQ